MIDTIELPRPRAVHGQAPRPTESDPVLGSEAPRLRPTLTYEEAGELLRVSKDTIRGLVERGVLHRPQWAYDVKRAVVTTVSVFEASGWPIQPLVAAVPTSTTATWEDS